MDLYDEKEHVISSDEYSDDDDDDDALMNDAIRAQNRIQLPSSEFMAQNNKHSKWQIEQQKQKQLSSLIRRNKISVIYKNKSIKWLNNKKQRERYKEHIYGGPKKRSISENSYDIKVPPSKKDPSDFINQTSDSTNLNKVVSIDEDDDNDIIDEVNFVEVEKKMQQQKLPESTEEKKKDTTLKSVENENKMEKDNRQNVFEAENVAHQKDFSPELKTNELAEKRARSSSPSIANDNNDNEQKRNATKKFRTESPQFYKKINEMFPKFDEIATNHINTMTSSTYTATEDKMKNILHEIQTLNEILHTKEMEWNRLLHLKMIKEEIYSRLSQKKHMLQLRENFTKTRSQNSLSELKELELYLSEKNLVSSETHLPSTSIQQLIENRANMKAEDLELEKNNTSRLHSLLVSRNMLHGIDTSQNYSFSNGDKNSIAITNKTSESYQQFDSRTLRGRQGEFKDVKSIIADFRQKNPELLPRVGKRIKSIESNSQIRNFSIPFFEKTTLHPQYLQFAKDHQSEFYPSRKMVEEISITPSGGSSKKLPYNHDIDFVNAMNNHYNVSLDDNYIKNDVKRDFDARSPNKNNQYPLCQECKIHESRFVCAGCGNQWYCSKKCQKTCLKFTIETCKRPVSRKCYNGVFSSQMISAWDKHSEICTD